MINLRDDSKCSHFSLIFFGFSRFSERPSELALGDFCTGHHCVTFHNGNREKT
jgi:hypothetical protein